MCIRDRIYICMISDAKVNGRAFLNLDENTLRLEFKVSIGFRLIVMAIIRSLHGMLIPW